MISPSNPLDEPNELGKLTIEPIPSSIHSPSISTIPRNIIFLVTTRSNEGITQLPKSTWSGDCGNLRIRS